MVGKLALASLSSILFVSPSASAAACPYAEAFKSGLLDRDLAYKYEAVKHDPENAARLIGAHHQAKRADPQQGGLAGLVGPIVDGVLDLPLGGGLRTLSLVVRIFS